MSLVQSWEEAVLFQFSCICSAKHIQSITLKSHFCLCNILKPFQNTQRFSFSFYFSSHCHTSLFPIHLSTLLFAITSLHYPILAPAYPSINLFLHHPNSCTILSLHYPIFIPSNPFITLLLYHHIPLLPYFCTIISLHYPILEPSYHFITLFV